MQFLAALLLLLATAAVDSGPLQTGLTSLQVASQSAELEDGPEGEQPAIAALLGPSDGDDQIRNAALSVAVVRVRYAVVAGDLKRSPLRPSHSPLDGFPTGPPRT